MVDFSRVSSTIPKLRISKLLQKIDEEKYLRNILLLVCPPENVNVVLCPYWLCCSVFSRTLLRAAIRIAFTSGVNWFTMFPQSLFKVASSISGLLVSVIL